MLYGPNIFRPAGGSVVLGRTLRRLFETGVILCR